MSRLPIILAAAAAAVITAGRVYHFAWHPEWTEPQAMMHLWAVWGVGALLAVGACVLSVAGSAFGRR